MKQISEILRPKKIENIVGQNHLTDNNNGIIAAMLKHNMIKSMIFTGPPGTGKSSMAEVIAKQSGLEYIKLNAVSCDSKDIKSALNTSLKQKVLLYLDEIQYLNKKQQQLLYPFIEHGSVVLIANTTDNPYYALQDALLSRCLICEFKKINSDELYQHLLKIKKYPDNVFNGSNFDFNPLADISDSVLGYIAKIVSGDVRRALNLIELAVTINKNPKITDIDNIIPSSNQSGFDKSGELHYQYISALQKSIRGSDVDASVFWLCKLLAGGDILSPCRRLPIIACEDIGLADPNAITHTISCVNAAEMLGLPEAYKPLTQAVIYLAMAPKSASNEAAYLAANKDIKLGLGTTVPSHIASTHAKNYIWPHSESYHYIVQQYLPDDLIHKKYYTPTPDAQFEKLRFEYWENIKKIKKETKS